MTKAYRSPMTQAVAPDNPLPEQAFFADPAMDRLMGVVMNLATEVFVLRERCAAQEAQLSAAGVLDADALSAEPEAAQAVQRLAEQQEFVAHLLEPMRGVQVSRGVTPEGSSS